MPSQQELMKKWEKAGSPGGQHRRLERFVGRWNASIRVWMEGPGKRPAESKGSSEVQWVLEGRFLLDEFSGEMAGRPYSGIGIKGYDNFRNLYVGSWIDSLNTHLLTMAGTCDRAGDVFTWYGRMDEPSIEVRGRTVKYVDRIIDEHRRILEILDLHSGDDHRVVEITYTRR